MNELIEELIKAIGLPTNYKAFPDIAKKFEVIDKIQEFYSMMCIECEKDLRKSYDNGYEEGIYGM